MKHKVNLLPGLFLFFILGNMLTTAYSQQRDIQITGETPVDSVLLIPEAKAVVEKLFPGISTYAKEAVPFNNYITFGNSISGEDIIKLQRALSEIDLSGRKSLDEIDREIYKSGASPLDLPIEKIHLQNGGTVIENDNQFFRLDGEWQLIEGGSESERLVTDWEGVILANVPGSVHTALVEAGKIPDPAFGKNQLISREESYKTWWMKKVFPRPKHSENEQLIFEGICNKTSIWLNGVKLGDHEGMFGGPEYDVSHLMKDQNTLIVRLEGIPEEYENNSEYNNSSWKRTVVFNNVYGWHYSITPSLGIWRSVRIYSKPAVSIEHPFISTNDAAHGIMDLVIRLNGPDKAWKGKLTVSISPENFEAPGTIYSFEKEINQEHGSSKEIHYQFKIPDPALWWPVDLGEQNLYKMQLRFKTKNQEDIKSIIFGIRTIEMAPLPGGPFPEKYNWTFVINGEAKFVKGTGWCTMDPLMDFSRERYDRVLSLAAMQHVQMLRGWGSGMPETDDFYDLCDRKGIMVIQEWPTAWNSETTQPFNVLEETVRLNTYRLRNHASLVMWGAGNETRYPFTDPINMMGRLSNELDGTRPFHRGEPWGGSLHNYDVWWGNQHLDRFVNMEADFFGEFGLASLPVYESVQRYLPDEEKSKWPPDDDGSFAFHTPIFNTAGGLYRLTQYANYFISRNAGMETFITGSQIAQAVGLRHTLENARTRWPYCSGALYYKMNDNQPAASWATVDWYGAPKFGHYIVQDAFEPLSAPVIFSTMRMAGTPYNLPVFLLDDAGSLKEASWNVNVRAYNDQLELIKDPVDYSGYGSIASPQYLGSFYLSFEETETSPLLIVSEVRKNDELEARNFYWTNYEYEKECLFGLPETQLELNVLTATEVVIKNTGSLPAVAVNVSRPGHLDTFTISDNYFWLDAGEEKIVRVNATDG
ncbi:glycoside hydrolase family 2 protein, partial [Bacteroidota bacterium]